MERNEFCKNITGKKLSKMHGIQRNKIMNVTTADPVVNLQFMVKNPGKT